MRVFGVSLSHIGYYEHIGQLVVESLTCVDDYINVTIVDTGGGDTLDVKIQSEDSSLTAFMVKSLSSFIGNEVEIENDMVYLVNGEVEEEISDGQNE